MIASPSPRMYVSFLGMINATELAMFGLPNRDPADQTFTDAKR
jgi:hypothetical protein